VPGSIIVVAGIPWIVTLMVAVVAIIAMMVVVGMIPGEMVRQVKEVTATAGEQHTGTQNT
jgi:hypothetical protein